MNSNEMLSFLLHNQDCPFGYQCLANDCLQCAELHQLEASGGNDEG